MSTEKEGGMTGIPMPNRPIVSHNERSIKPKTTPLAMIIPTEKGLVPIKGTHVLFNEMQIQQLTRRIAQLGEMHDHAALEEIMQIGVAISDDASLRSTGKRKVIQMDGLKVLCDDGTMWLWQSTNDGGEYSYVRLNNVPQD